MTSDTEVKPIFLSAIAHLHGEPRPLEALGEPTPVDFTRPEHGLKSYCVSDLSIREIATRTAREARERAGGDADLVIYATENDHATTETLAHVARQLKVPTAKYIAISGHACGNLGPGLELARDALASGKHRRVLLVMADCASAHGRVMSTGLSVFSDGGAACMLTNEPPANGSGPTFAVRSVTTQVGADTNPADPAQMIPATVSLGERAIQDLLKSAGVKRDTFRFVLFANYRISSQRFLTSAMGFSVDRLLLGPIAEVAHSFSADIVTNLVHLVDTKKIAIGDRMVVSATGPFTWSIADVESV